MQCRLCGSVLVQVFMPGPYGEYAAWECSEKKSCRKKFWEDGTFPPQEDTTQEEEKVAA